MTPTAAPSKVRNARLEVGGLPVVHALFSGVHLGALIALLVLWPAAVLAIRDDRQVLTFIAGAGGLIAFLTLLSAGLVWRRARTLQPGTPGRGRLLFRAAMSFLFVPLSAAPIGILAYGAHRAGSSGFAFTYSLEEAALSIDPGARLALIVTGVATLVLLAIDLGLIVSAWFLLPRRLRVAVWIVLDLALAVAYLWVTWNLSLDPATSDLADLQEPITRLSVTAFFAARVGIRLMPVLMGGILERLDFHTLVAARHLRSKKSGFLAAIGSLSILAVAVSSCMLTTVLSVMGGFRDDLKQKILGNHAHVVIEAREEPSESDEFEGWSAVLDAARAAPHVLAATPYVEGEVMVTSASNRAAAIMRGIDSASIGDVTDLEDNLTNGSLEYLVHPEQLLHLPAEERRSILPLEMFPNSRDEDEPEDDGTSLIREVDDLIQRQVRDADVRDEERRDEDLREQRGAGEDETDVRIQDVPVEDVPLDDVPLAPPDFDELEVTEDVLPGIVVGKELARTLRLFVGDEIDVVSPLGELGPAGPMPKARRYRVAGVFYSGMYEYDMKLVYVTMESAQRFLNTGDAITGIEIKIDDVERAPEIARGVASAVGRDDLRTQDWQEVNKNLFGALALEKLAMFVTLGIAILIAGFCVFGTLTLMVQEKGREVGILKAMGTTSRSVVGVFLFEGLLIGIFGAITGLGLGYLVVFILENFGIRLNPEVYYIDRLPVHTDPMEFLIVGVSAILICVVATIFPALLASRMRPIDALRHY